MYQFSDISAGNGGSAAALRVHPSFARPSVGRSFGARAASRPRLELVADLGVRIGSRDWYRGLFTCVTLCVSAAWFSPGFEPVAGATPAPFNDAQWEDARALTIAPLAYGADTGRRMAPTDAVEPLMDAPERPIVNLVATLGHGDSFSRALERAGVAEAEAARLAQLVADAVDPTQIKPGTAMDLTLGRRPHPSVARPLEALAFRARFDLKLEIARVDGRLSLKQIPVSVDDTPLRVQGTVGSSLYRSARAAGAPAKAVEAFIRAIAGQINIGSLTADDRFDLIIKHRRAATGESEAGPLLFAGLDRAGGKDIQLMQWTLDGRTQWFEAEGVGKATGMLQRPVPGSVSSNFGMRRHPILGYSRMHRGMDFRAGYGTPILAATDGQVTVAGWHGGYGKQVRISHGGGLLTSYSHMSRITAQRGDFVRKGQVIGYVGSTGLSTGPHLHYELYKDGVPMNPASVRFTTRAQLAGQELARFREKLRGLLAVPVGVARMPEVRTAQTDPSAPSSGPRPGFSI